MHFPMLCAFNSDDPVFTESYAESENSERFFHYSVKFYASDNDSDSFVSENQPLLLSYKNPECIKATRTLSMV